MVRRAAPRAAAAWRLAEVVGALAWGDGDGEHAEALRRGIDALSLAAVAADDEAAGGAALSDGRLLALLEGIVRALSNLSEALHHSHYAYLLLTPSTFIALARSAPALHAPPLASLLLRAAAHTAAAAASVAASSEGAGTLDALVRMRRRAAAGRRGVARGRRGAAAAPPPAAAARGSPPRSSAGGRRALPSSASAAAIGAADVLACAVCAVGAIGSRRAHVALARASASRRRGRELGAAVLLPWPAADYFG